MQEKYKDIVQFMTKSKQTLGKRDLPKWSGTDRL